MKTLSSCGTFLSFFIIGSNSKYHNTAPQQNFQSGTVASDASLSTMNSLLPTPSKTTTSPPMVNVVLNFNRLNQQKEPRVRLNISRSYYWLNMATANDKYLLYASGDFLSLIDTKGHEHLNVKQSFTINDICWSSYLNQFLVLSSRDKTIYSLDITTSRREPYAEVKKLSKMSSYDTCTCYQETFLVGGDTFIEEYKLSNWRLIRTFQPRAQSPDYDDWSPPLPRIKEIRFSSNGTHIGVITRDNSMGGEWGCSYHFELRSRDNLMEVLKTIHIHIGEYEKPPHLLSIPIQQFLIYSADSNQLLLMDSDCKVKEKTLYQAARGIQAIALLNDNKCLVIQTEKQLHFHDV